MSKQRPAFESLIRGAMVVLFVVTALVLVGWIFLSGSILGNDFQIVTKFILTRTFYEKLGLLPHWYHFMEGGIPWATPHQAFHLPAWLFTFFPGYLEGNANVALGIKYLLLLALGQGLTYRFLRRQIEKISRAGAFLVSLVIVYQLRSLDALRYMIFLDALIYMHCLALLFVDFIEQPSKFRFLGMVFLSQLLFTSTYQTVVAFGALEIFILTLWLAAQKRDQKTAGHEPDWKVFFQRVGVAATAAVIGLGMSAPNLLVFGEWLNQNHVRGTHASLEWADSFPMEWSNSFWALFRPAFLNAVMPWFADVCSAFGGSTLLSLLAFAVIIYLGQTFRRNSVLLAGILLTYLYALGTKTPVFPFFFSTVPGFSHFRVAGRIFTVLPTLLTLGFIEMAKGSDLPVGREKQKNAVLGACLIQLGLTFFAFYSLYFLDLENSLKALVRAHSEMIWYPIRLHPLAWTQRVFSLWLGSGVITIGAVGWWGLRKRENGNRTQACLMAVIGLVTLLQCGYLFRYGTFTVPKNTPLTSESIAKADHLPLQNNQPLYYLHFLSAGAALQSTIQYTELTEGATSCFFRFTNAIDRRWKGHIDLPWYLTPYLICSESWRRLSQSNRERICKGPIGAIVEGDCNTDGIPPRTPQSFQRLIELNQPSVIRFLNPNQIELELSLSEPAILSTAIPFHENWAATINGKPGRIVKTNGGLIGIPLQVGHQQVGLAYHSDAVWYGYLIFVALALALFLALIEIKWDRFAVLRTRGVRILLSLVLIGVTVGLIKSSLRQSYLNWETSEVGLNHHYPNLLEVQIKVWTKMAQEKDGG